MRTIGKRMKSCNNKKIFEDKQEPNYSLALVTWLIAKRLALLLAMLSGEEDEC